MDIKNLYALDEQNRRHVPLVEERNGILCLTFKKETLREVKHLS